MLSPLTQSVLESLDDSYLLATFNQYDDALVTTPMERVLASRLEALMAEQKRNEYTALDETSFDADDIRALNEAVQEAGADSKLLSRLHDSDIDDDELSSLLEVRNVLAEFDIDDSETLRNLLKVADEAL